jgi:hypothetical protein
MEEGKEVEKKNGKEGMYFGFLRHVKTTVLQGF